MKTAALICATNFSFLRGASHPDEMVLTAQAQGYAAIGVADRNTLAGVVRAHIAAKEAGMKVLIGARLVTQDGFEVAAFPKDRPAYARLTRLLTLGNRRAPKGECHLSTEDILAHAEGQALILLPPPRLSPAWEQQAEAFVQALRSASRQSAGIWTGMARGFDGTDGARLHRLAELAETWGAPGVAIADALYHAPERRPLQDVLTCVREKTTIDAVGRRLEMNAERHLKPPEELARLFADHPDAVARTAEIADAVNFSLDELAYQYPDEILIEGETPMATLSRLAWEGAHDRYPDGVPDNVRTAIEHELKLIAELDYAPYFLTVYDLVRYAREQGILCQGRGSAANSVVCYCVGITSVDPTRVNLLFERFVSAERGEPPDIDVDFEHNRREEVIQYVYDKYGRHRASMTAVVSTYRAKGAIRDVGKAMGLSADTLDALSKTVWGWSEAGVTDEHVRTELGLDPRAPRLRQALTLARELIGFPRHLSQHPGGFVMTRDRLDEIVPVMNAAMEDRTCIEWDKDDIDALGLLKVDVLALGMLTAIAGAFEMLENHYQRPLTLASVPPEDPRVYDMICKADTLGVFQIESRAQMSMLPRLKPRNYYDLVIEVAIVRPGPIQGDMVHPYLRRRDGIEKVDYPSKELEEVLGKTMGVPLFQEQAMKIAVVAAGFTPGESDKLRRAMATFRRNGTIYELESRFINGMIANGYECDFAERCFRQIEGFGDYGFPESHAASFALLVYVSCWLKKWYPDVFCAAMLNAQPMGFYAPAQLVRDAREHGVEVRAPDVNFSDWDCTLEERSISPPPGGEGTKRWGAEIEELSALDDHALVSPMPQAATAASNLQPKSRPAAPHPLPPPHKGEGKRRNAHAVRLGLRQIKGFPEPAAAKIMAARADGPFTSLEDLERRARIGAQALEKLARADACRSLGQDRREALWAGKGVDLDPGPLFAQANRPDAPAALPVMSQAEHVAHDYATLKLSLKAHPVSFFRPELTGRRVIACEDLMSARDKSYVRVAGLVLVRQRPGTASGVIFCTLEDETSIANIIVWPRVFERYRKTVMRSRFLVVEGRVQKEGIVIHIVAEKLIDLSERLADLADGDEGDYEVTANADEIRRPGEDPRAITARRLAARRARAEAITPKSRDFH